MNSDVDRRRLIKTLGATTVAVPALAACAGQEPDAAPTPPRSPDAPSASTSSPAAQALASVDDVPVGGGVVIGGRQVGVTQPTAGEFKAFSSACPHEGCAVTEVRDAEIICPCHFSKFSVIDGEVLSGPAEQGLTEIGVRVQDGDLVLD